MTAPRSTAVRPYAERWLEKTYEDKINLVGTAERAAELDALATEVGAGTQSMLRRARRRLKGAVVRMNNAKRLYEQTQIERNSYMIEEAILGAQQATIAEEAGVTAMIVSFALGSSSRSNWSRKGRARRPQLEGDDEEAGAAEVEEAAAS